MRLYDGSGRHITLGREIGRGGEGAVSEVSHDRELVAKVYLNPVEPEKDSKLRSMTSMASSGLLRISAWPISTLHDSPRGRLVGVLMPKVSGHREVHQLYGPIHRKLHYPKADWEFLFHVAMNCAAAFETVHEAGHVIGDVNQGGVMVSDDGTVRLIDCDSFQIRDQGRMYYCVVGVPEYTPPELQGRSTFRGVEREPTHDCFGLALLVFHLLFMGRHPFAGQFRGQGDMPIERSISEGRFAFGRSASSFQMAPPPHALPLDAVPPEIAELFETAFTRPTSRNFIRPSAAKWRVALGRAKGNLRRCATDPIHRYPPHLVRCPWCLIEEGGGPAFFISLAATVSFDAGFSLASVWKAIQDAQWPPGANALVILPAPASSVPKPFPTAARYRDLGQRRPLAPKPVLFEEPFPEIQEYKPEQVPEDPVFVPVAPPVLAPFKDHNYRAIAKARIREAIIDDEYRVTKWGAISTGALAAIAGYFHVMAGLGLCVVFIPILIVWLIKRIPLQRLYREALNNGKVEAQRRREQRVRDEQQLADERIRVMHENNARRIACQLEADRLALERAGTSTREPARRQAWEMEVARARIERAAVERRNEERRKDYERAVQKYERVVQDIYQHNLAIDSAKRSYDEEHKARLSARNALRDQINGTRHQWEKTAVAFKAEFQGLVDRLGGWKAEYESLMREFDRDLAKLNSSQQNAQKREYLQNQLVDEAFIRGIGRGRKRTLAAYGIETALDLDVNALADIPGFGPTLIADLLAWRDSVAASFRFDPRKTVSSIELRGLHMRYHSRRQALQVKLRGGPELLQAVANRASRQLADVDRTVIQLSRSLAQAEADLTVY